MRASASNSSSSSASPVTSQPNIYQLPSSSSSSLQKMSLASSNSTVTPTNSAGPSKPNYDNIQIVVDDSTFIVNPDIFSRDKDSMLYRMFFGPTRMAKANDIGQYKIEGFSSTIFSAVLVGFELFCVFFQIENNSLFSLGILQNWPCKMSVWRDPF